MVRRIKEKNKFVTINSPKAKPHIREIYFGERDETGNHGHISTSGAIIVGEAILAETWYARTPKGRELIKRGRELTSNAPQLLSNCIPKILVKARFPGQSLFWNVGSLDTFSSLKKEK